tara:strand:+ start:188 stop:841 length:654 start_codon:yes stop_codon:yes gene_type:complete
MKNFKKILCIVLVASFLSTACGETSVDGEASTSDALLELLLSESEDSAEIASALEKLSVSIELLSKSIEESSNRDNELLGSLSKSIESSVSQNFELMQALSNEMADFSNNNSEIAKATRELAFINFLNTIYSCITSVQVQTKSYLQDDLTFDTYDVFTQSGKFYTCLGLDLGEEASKRVAAFLNVNDKSDYGTTSIFELFHSQEFADFFLEEISRVN